MAKDLTGKRVLFMATDGFEEVELTEPLKALEKAGATVEIASLKTGKIQGWDKTDWGKSVKVDLPLSQADAKDYDALVLATGRWRGIDAALLPPMLQNLFGYPVIDTGVMMAPRGVGVLAILALLMVRIRPLFWLFVVAFNVVGAIDILVDYYHATQVGLPAMAGELGSTYAIPIIYVPLLMITHAAAFHLLARRPLSR